MQAPLSSSLLLALAALPASAAPLQDGALKLDEEAVDALFARWDRADSPGCSLAVVHRGEVVFAKGYGMANLDWQIPIGPQTVFRIGSVSKQITAAVIALLAQEDQLSLNDDIRIYLPELPDYGTPITISHLVHHTSGIRDYLGLMYLSGYEDQDYYTDEEAIAAIARQSALNFPPGERQLYSNSGYLLLAEIAKRVTKKSLRELAEERIFGPLGMEHTHYHDDHTEIVAKRALGYAMDADRWRISTTNLDLIGDGGVFTTVLDFAKWDQNFYDAEVGGPEFIRLLQTPGLLNSGVSTGYAFGLGVGEYKGRRQVSHAGGFVGYRAEMVRFPDDELSVICFSNSGGSLDPTEKCFAVAELALGLSEPTAQATEAAATTSGYAEPTFIALDQAAARELEGIYRGSGQVLQVVDAGAELRVSVSGFEFGARPVSATVFREVPGTPLGVRLTFQRDEAGSVNAVRIEPEGQGTLTLERVDASEFPDFTPFAGRYWSEELQVTYELRAEDGALTCRAGRVGGQLTPQSGDAFASDFGPDFAFERDGEGRVSGFRLGMGRVQGVVFERRE